MERSDLLQVNGGIFTVQGEAIGRSAKTGCRVLVVGNPCNTNALICQSASGLPSTQIHAMTMLDQNRAMSQLALKSGVDVKEVRNLCIWGNHSATQYPDFFNATIKGIPVPEVILEAAWLQEDFIKTVQQRGAAIIKARGASSAASAANAAIDTICRLNQPTPVGEWFSAAVPSDGSYGIPKGMIFSFF